VRKDPAHYFLGNLGCEVDSDDSDVYRYSLSAMKREKHICSAADASDKGTGSLGLSRTFNPIIGADLEVGSHRTTQNTRNTAKDVPILEQQVNRPSKQDFKFRKNDFLRQNKTQFAGLQGKYQDCTQV
jgi:hypothetical protein